MTGNCRKAHGANTAKSKKHKWKQKSEEFHKHNLDTVWEFPFFNTISTQCLQGFKTWSSLNSLAH